MGAQSTVDIHVRTTGDASGADKINAALGSVEKETKLNVEAMQRLEAATARTQQFFTPAAINPWATASAGAKVNLDNLHISQTQAAGSSRNLGGAILQASRGLQDMQYGLAGAVNNLEGIASSLGLGAGVAGAVTLVAVAVQTLGPSVVNWLKSLDTEGAKLDNLVTGLNRAADAIKGEYSSNTENAKRLSDEFSEALKKEAGALDASTKAIEQNQKMLKARNDVQKTADELKLESDIEDIKAQNLPKDQEKAAIAARKREALDAEKARADNAARKDIEGDAGKLTDQAKARDALKARQAALEKEKAGSLEYATLQKEQAGLEAKKREAEIAANKEREMYSKAGMAVPENAQSKKILDDANAKLDANKARQKELTQSAPEGRIRGVDEINKNLDEVTPQAKEAADKTAKDAQALRDKREAERVAQIGRDNVYQREAEKIAREEKGGVFNQGNLKAPPAGLGNTPAPLPAPAAPGSTLPVPMLGPAELNPERIGSTAPGPTFGPQPNAAESAPTSEKGSEKISAAAQKNADAFDRAAQMVEKLAEQTDKRLKAMEQKIRSQGVMA